MGSGVSSSEECTADLFLLWTPLRFLLVTSNDAFFCRLLALVRLSGIVTTSEVLSTPWSIVLDISATLSRSS